MDSFPHFFSGALMIFIIYTLHNSLFSTWGLQVLQVQQELLMLQTSIPSVSQERIFYRLNKGTKEGYRWDSFVNNTYFFKGWHCHLVHEIVFRVSYIFVPGVTLVTIWFVFWGGNKKYSIQLVYLLFKQLGSIKSRTPIMYDSDGKF